MMYLKRLAYVSMVVAALLFTSPSPGRAAGVPDIETLLFRGDIFVNDGSGTLINPTTATPNDAPLYNAAGAPLNLTWGRWQSANAFSVAVTTRGTGQPQTQVSIRLHGLVPSGVYSIYYATFGPDTINPACPTAE